MSTQSTSDAEAFYSFLGLSLQQGDRETPPEALLRKWRAEREFYETCEAIREGMADIEAGRCRPFEEAAADLRRKFGITES